MILVAICATVLAAFCQKSELVVGKNAHYQVKISTSIGNFEVVLYNDTPMHRDNFVKLAKDGFYDNILFHRVIKNFMIQAGDPTTKVPSAIAQYGDEDSGYLVDAEIVETHYHKKGVLAAARMGDDVNAERKSSGSQFYVVVGKIHTDSTLNAASAIIERNGGHKITPEREAVYKKIGGVPHLDGSYTIFGEVKAGMTMVEKISKMETTKLDRPKEDVYITKMEVKTVRD